MKRILAAIPLVLVIILGGFLLWGLNEDRDPNEIPSALIGREMPELVLKTIPGLSDGGLDPGVVSTHEIALVNVFASWCVPCRAEHGPLSQLAVDEDLPLYGLNYRDQADAAFEWLEELGNSYQGIGFDETGRAGIEWGISGVPETFILQNGVIVHRHLGPIVGETATRQFMDALNAVRGAS
ncbi:MAG: DsbE family thiol:disulfide interchange protein [Pseudomonadota bacterium]